MGGDQNILSWLHQLTNPCRRCQFFSWKLFLDLHWSLGKLRGPHLNTNSCALVAAYDIHLTVEKHWIHREFVSFPSFNSAFLHGCSIQSLGTGPKFLIRSTDMSSMSAALPFLIVFSTGLTSLGVNGDAKFFTSNFGYLMSKFRNQNFIRFSPNLILI